MRDHQPMAVRSCGRYLAHPPKPVGRRLPYDRASLPEIQHAAHPHRGNADSRNSYGRPFAPEVAHRDSGRSSPGR